MVGFDIRKVMDVLVTDILAEGDVKTAKILQSVFARLGSQCYTVGHSSFLDVFTLKSSSTYIVYILYVNITSAFI